mmetsp:Transcript_9580/g.20999  ORF Transcript_9580/g.20999 Transcript_9580/m.20999 type:complete len:203 (-) Transcript_9580:1097-1705(-)
MPSDHKPRGEKRRRQRKRGRDAGLYFGMSAATTTRSTGWKCSAESLARLDLPCWGGRICLGVGAGSDRVGLDLTLGFPSPTLAFCLVSLDQRERVEASVRPGMQRATCTHLTPAASKEGPDVALSSRCSDTGVEPPTPAPAASAASAAKVTAASAAACSADIDTAARAAVEAEAAEDTPNSAPAIGRRTCTRHSRRSSSSAV